MIHTAIAIIATLLHSSSNEDLYGYNCIDYRHNAYKDTCIEKFTSKTIIGDEIILSFKDSAWTPSRTHSFLNSISCYYAVFQDCTLLILEQIHSKESNAEIIREMEKHENTYNTIIVNDAYASIAIDTFSQAIHFFRIGLSKKNPFLRGESAIALSRFNDTSSIPKIRSLLKDTTHYEILPHEDPKIKRPRVCDRAKEALAAFDHPAMRDSLKFWDRKKIKANSSNDNF